MSNPHGVDLSTDARAIVDAARLDEDPSRADVDRLRGRVFAHLGIGLATGAAATLAAGTTAEAAVASGATATAGATASATKVVASTGILAKLGLFGSAATAAKLAVAVVVVGASTAGVVSVSSSERAPSPAASSMGSRPSDPSAQKAAAERGDVPAAPAPSSAIAPPEREEEAPPAEAKPESKTEAAKPSAALAAPPSAAPAVDPLAEETALLARAQSALAAGRHDEALAALDEHQRRFPKGTLSHERNAARLLALCGSGRAGQARSAVEAFLAKEPSSPLAARLRSACGVEDR